MAHDAAGDPITGLKWSRKTLGKIAEKLESHGISVSGKTVGRLLKKMGYSLKVNKKNVSKGGKKLSNPEKEDRDRQFNYISELREKYAKRNEPIISVDSKKKEKIGNFKNEGSAYKRKAEETNDHDFNSYAVGKLTPYGIADIKVVSQKNGEYSALDLFTCPN